MHLARITLKHAGKHYSAIEKINVTPAEIQLLKAIHGSDAVSDVRRTGEVDGKGEKDRLLRLYGSKEEIAQMVDRLFPGINASLPETLEEIGVEDAKFEPVVEKAPKRNTLSAKQSEAILA